MRVRQFLRLAALVALATPFPSRPATAEDRVQDQDRMLTVTGRLLDADGKPVADGQVVLVAELWCRTERPLGIYVHNGLPITFGVTRPFQTDSEGRFRATRGRPLATCMGGVRARDGQGPRSCHGQARQVVAH